VDGKAVVQLLPGQARLRPHTGYGPKKCPNVVVGPQVPVPGIERKRDSAWICTSVTFARFERKGTNLRAAAPKMRAGYLVESVEKTAPVGSARAPLSGGYEKPRGEFTLQFTFHFCLDVSLGWFRDPSRRLHTCVQELMRAVVPSFVRALRDPRWKGQCNGCSQGEYLHSTVISRYAPPF